MYIYSYSLLIHIYVVVFQCIAHRKQHFISIANNVNSSNLSESFSFSVVPSYFSLFLLLMLLFFFFSFSPLNVYFVLLIIKFLLLCLCYSLIRRLLSLANLILPKQTATKMAGMIASIYTYTVDRTRAEHNTYTQKQRKPNLTTKRAEKRKEKQNKTSQ